MQHTLTKVLELWSKTLGWIVNEKNVLGLNAPASPECLLLYGGTSLTKRYSSHEERHRYISTRVCEFNQLFRHHVDHVIRMHRTMRKRTCGLVFDTQVCGCHGTCSLDLLLSCDVCKFSTLP